MPLLFSALVLATSSILSLPQSNFISNVATQVVDQTADTSQPDLRIEPFISSIASEYKVSSTTMYNVAVSESQLQADPPGHNDGGRACGVVQVHAALWGFDCQDLKEHPEVGLEFLAQRIQAGDAWKYWTSLNCYTYVSHMVPNLPRMADIQPNTSAHKGAVVIFYYPSKGTSVATKHIAVQTSEVKNGAFIVDEANKTSGVIGTRVVNINDPYLAGFWVG